MGVPIGVEIDTAKEGVLAADVVALGTKLAGGIADADAGTAAVGAAVFQDAGMDFMAHLASWSDSFNESFFLINVSRSEQAVLYSFSIYPLLPLQR